jgi:hypothetical protein
MQRFADGMADIESAIRRARRPLPTCPPPGSSRRQWVAALLIAEVRHATEDFWRCVHWQGAGLLFDCFHREREADPFRFPHEVRAREALRWLSDLNMHESDRHGPWSTWVHLNETQRAAWTMKWFQLARGFLRRMQAYQVARKAFTNVAPLLPRPVRPTDRPARPARMASRAWDDPACRWADRQRDRP